jgi:hypothetical protein
MTTHEKVKIAVGHQTLYARSWHDSDAKPSESEVRFGSVSRPGKVGARSPRSANCGSYETVIPATPPSKAGPMPGI